MRAVVRRTGRDRACAPLPARAGPVGDGWHACAAGCQARRWGADRGSGTLWALTFMTVVWLAAVLAMTVGGVRAARHRAHAAADLAALAAASHAAAGAGAGRACARAAEIATGSGARLSACVLRGRVADVTVTMTIRVAVSSHRMRVVARSRAGPSDHRFPGRNLRSRDSLYRVSNSAMEVGGCG